MKNQLVNRNELNKNRAFLDYAFTPDVSVILIKVSTTFYHKVYNSKEDLEKDKFRFIEETIGRIPKMVDTIVTDRSLIITPDVQSLLNKEFKYHVRRNPTSAISTERIINAIIKNR